MNEMGVFVSRFRMVRQWLRELHHSDREPTPGDAAKGTVFLLDGVGGTMFAPMCIRRGLREAGVVESIEMFDWHSGPRGELLYDLMAQRHNRRKALRLASVIADRRARHPDAPIHVVALSGGTGFAAFSLEELPKGVNVDTVILACSALSPRYRLTEMLKHVRHCVALVSRRDWVMLGLGTTLFGTMDRRFGPSAGMVGFRRPEPFGEEDARQYAKFHQIFWQPSLKSADNFGHHVGWATVAFSREYLAPLLRGTCKLPMHSGPADAAKND